MAAKLTLSDVTPPTITAVVNNLETGKSTEVDFCPPTLLEWQEIVFTIASPVPPKKQRMVNGAKEDFLDTNDPEYLISKAKFDESISMRRVCHALIKAGNFEEELKGLTLEKATEELFKVADRAILYAVLVALNKYMQGMRGGVDQKKATFQGQSLHPTSDENNHKNEQGLRVVETA
jgi:hypothetical protein